MATKRYLVHAADRAGGPQKVVLSAESVDKLRADGWIVRLADKQLITE